MPADESNFFRARRKELDLSLTEVSFALRLSVSAIGGWERGNVPSIDYVDKLAEVYRVSTRKILDVMHEMSRARRELALAGK